MGTTETYKVGANGTTVKIQNAAIPQNATDTPPGGFPRSGQAETGLVTRKGSNIAPWGNNDNFPLEAYYLLENDKDIPQILKAKRNYLLGNINLCTFKRSEEDPNELVIHCIPEIEAWKRANRRKLRNFLMKVTDTYLKLGNYFVEYITSRDGEKLSDFNVVEAAFVRAHIKDAKGNIPKYQVYQDARTLAGQTVVDKNTVEDIPSYEARPKAGKFIYHGKDQQAGHEYYAAPDWHGSKTMIELRRKGVEGLSNFLSNELNFKYLVIIHEQYYIKQGCDESEEGRVKKKELEQALLNKIEAFFKGEDNTGKTLFTTAFESQFGKELIPYIQIQPINDQANYSERLNLINQSNLNMSVSFGLSPTLAGMDTKANLSSGSQVNYESDMHQAIKTPLDRAIILESIWNIFEINGWTEKYKDDFDEIGFTHNQVRRMEDSKTAIKANNL